MISDCSSLLSFLQIPSLLIPPFALLHFLFAFSLLFKLHFPKFSPPSANIPHPPLTVSLCFYSPYYIQKENIRQPCFPNISKKRTILSRQSSHPLTCYFLLLFPFSHTSCNQQNHCHASHRKYHCDLRDRGVVAGADVSARRIR